MSSTPSIIGVIIAGGKSSRMMGNEKCLLPLRNKLIISQIIERLEPQVDSMLINANGDSKRFDFTNLPITPDIINHQEGPLVGIYSAMIWAKENISNNAMIACVPSDAPFIPYNLIAKLKDTYNNEKADIACVSSNEGLHPIFNLIPVSLHNDLHKTLTKTNTRAVYKWFKKHNLAKVSFPEQNGIDPFFNINTPQDLKNAVQN